MIPATADIIGKAANGIADDLLSTAILNYPHPILFVPAMNPSMWANKALKRNLATLREDGHYIVPPEVGVSVTSGDWDQGLGPTPEVLLQHLQHFHLRHLRDAYWDKATATKPLSPSEKLLQPQEVAIRTHSSDHSGDTPSKRGTMPLVVNNRSGQESGDNDDKGAL